MAWFAVSIGVIFWVMIVSVVVSLSHLIGPLFDPCWILPAAFYFNRWSAYVGGGGAGLCFCCSCRLFIFVFLFYLIVSSLSLLAVFPFASPLCSHYYIGPVTAGSVSLERVCICLVVSCFILLTAFCWCACFAPFSLIAAVNSLVFPCTASRMTVYLFVCLLRFRTTLS